MEVSWLVSMTAVCFDHFTCVFRVSLHSVLAWMSRKNYVKTDAAACIQTEVVGSNPVGSYMLRTLVVGLRILTRCLSCRLRTRYHICYLVHSEEESVHTYFLKLQNIIHEERNVFFLLFLHSKAPSMESFCKLTGPFQWILQTHSDYCVCWVDYNERVQLIMEWGAVKQGNYCCKVFHLRWL